LPKAPLEPTDDGTLPQGDGWFVLNAKDARWFHTEPGGAYCGFEGDPRFPQLGINLNVLRPGEWMSMYHSEDMQEDFLVLEGECVLVVEGEERALRAWDLFHCPAGVAHTIVGAGERPALVLAVGSRPAREIVYPVDETALRHGAGVERETTVPQEAYAPFPTPQPGPYREGLLEPGRS
jgi:uncharacterized cupin superfamily protein